MMLININKIFENAVLEDNIETLEKILSSSDSKKDLIEHFAQNNDLEVLRKILPKFRSKGLVQNLEDCCDLVSSCFKIKKSKEGFESSKVVLIHYRNKEENKVKHLQESVFDKNRII